ncbi:hypothetical protein CBEVV_007 [Choristoneura biennis entomopoxvirus 'L' virophage]|nr:hypothetical protein CBEVV_007 [Choristoneura biennis entomopoxvirus 'L' virophage]
MELLRKQQEQFYNGKGILSANKINETLSVYLTPLQVKKYNLKHEIRLTRNAFTKPPNYNINIDKKDMKHINKIINNEAEEHITGGFIMPLLGALAAGTSIATSIYKTINDKKTNNDLIKLKNKQIEILNKQHKEGKPINVNNITANEYAKSLSGTGIHKTKSKMK